MLRRQSLDFSDVSGGLLIHSYWITMNAGNGLVSFARIQLLPPLTHEQNIERLQQPQGWHAYGITAADVIQKCLRHLLVVAGKHSAQSRVRIRYQGHHARLPASR